MVCLVAGKSKGNRGSVCLTGNFSLRMQNFEYRRDFAPELIGDKLLTFPQAWQGNIHFFGENFLVVMFP